MPTGAAREYLRLFGVAAVYVAAAGDDACAIGSTLDVQKSQAFLPSRDQRLEIVAVFWVRDGRSARTLARMTRARLPRSGVKGMAAVGVAVALDRLEAIALERSIQLTEHAVAMSRVTSAMVRLDAELVRAQAAGELVWFNEGFREWRLRAKAGGRIKTFGEAQARLRRALTRRLITGEAVGSLQKEVFPELLSPIFGFDEKTGLTG